MPARQKDTLAPWAIRKCRTVSPSTSGLGLMYLMAPSPARIRARSGPGASPRPRLRGHPPGTAAVPPRGRTAPPRRERALVRTGQAQAPGPGLPGRPAMAQATGGSAARPRLPHRRPGGSAARPRLPHRRPGQRRTRPGGQPRPSYALPPRAPRHSTADRSAARAPGAGADERGTSREPGSGPGARTGLSGAPGDVFDGRRAMRTGPSRTAARACEGRSAGSRHRRDRLIRCTRPGSSRRGTVPPSGPPGSATRARAALASPTPSPATPPSPSVIRPRMRPSPRPGRSSTMTCCRTGGRRAPTGIGARTRARSARSASARPAASRPVLARPPLPAAVPEQTFAAAPQRQSPRRRGTRHQSPPSRLGPAPREPHPQGTRIASGPWRRKPVIPRAAA